MRCVVEVSYYCLDTGYSNAVGCECVWFGFIVVIVSYLAFVICDECTVLLDLDVNWYVQYSAVQYTVRYNTKYKAF